MIVPLNNTKKCASGNGNVHNRYSNIVIQYSTQIYIVIKQKESHTSEVPRTNTRRATDSTRHVRHRVTIDIGQRVRAANTGSEIWKWRNLRDVRYRRDALHGSGDDATAEAGRPGRKDSGQRAHPLPHALFVSAFNLTVVGLDIGIGFNDTFDSLPDLLSLLNAVDVLKD